MLNHQYLCVQIIASPSESKVKNLNFLKFATNVRGMPKNLKISALFSNIFTSTYAAQTEPPFLESA